MYCTVENTEEEDPGICYQPTPSLSDGALKNLPKISIPRVWLIQMWFIMYE